MNAIKVIYHVAFVCQTLEMLVFSLISESSLSILSSHLQSFSALPTYCDRFFVLSFIICV